MLIPSLRSPYLRAGGCASTNCQIRIAQLLDTYLAATLTAFSSDNHRIYRHVDTVGAATEYVFGRREMRERGDLSDERWEINKENRIGRHEDAANRRRGVLPYAMINNNSINNLKTKES